MKQRLDETGSYPKALWGYNAGPGNLKNGILPKETIEYIGNVMENYQKLIGDNMDNNMADVQKKTLAEAKLFNDELASNADNRKLAFNAQIKAMSAPKQTAPEQPKKLSFGEKVGETTKGLSDIIYPLIGAIAGGLGAGPMGALLGLGQGMVGARGMRNEERETSALEDLKSLQLEQTGNQAGIENLVDIFNAQTNYDKYVAAREAKNRELQQNEDFLNDMKARREAQSGANKFNFAPTVPTMRIDLD